MGGQLDCACACCVPPYFNVIIGNILYPEDFVLFMNVPYAGIDNPRRSGCVRPQRRLHFNYHEFFVFLFSFLYTDKTQLKGEIVSSDTVADHPLQQGNCAINEKKPFPFTHQSYYFFCLRCVQFIIQSFFCFSFFLPFLLRVEIGVAGCYLWTVKLQSHSVTKHFLKQKHSGSH